MSDDKTKETPVSSPNTAAAAAGCGSSLSFLIALPALVVAVLAYQTSKQNEAALNNANMLSTVGTSSTTNNLRGSDPITSESTNSCIMGQFQSSSLWDSAIIGPTGSELSFEQAILPENVGSRYPFSGEVHDVAGEDATAIGSSVEICTFAGGTMWQCQVSL